MKLQELMVPEVVQVALDDSIAVAAKRMCEKSVGCLVITIDRTIKGIITDRDLLGCIGQAHDPYQCKVSAHMSRPVIVLRPEEELVTAADVMRRRGIKRLPIAEGGRLLGIVSLSDLASRAAKDLDTATRLIAAVVNTRGTQAAAQRQRLVEGNGSPQPASA
jgi:signal-transduction protein with cAMP-binding, CBS, and nucleotidyltransferase domain